LKPVLFERFYRAAEKADKIINPPDRIRMISQPPALKEGIYFYRGIDPPDTGGAR
jgi:hypothetical protein